MWFHSLIQLEYWRKSSPLRIASIQFTVDSEKTKVHRLACIQIGTLVSSLLLAHWTEQIKLTAHLKPWCNDWGCLATVVSSPCGFLMPLFWSDSTISKSSMSEVIQKTNGNHLNKQRMKYKYIYIYIDSSYTLSLDYTYTDHLPWFPQLRFFLRGLRVWFLQPHLTKVTDKKSTSTSISWKSCKATFQGGNEARSWW